MEGTPASASSPAQSLPVIRTNERPQLAKHYGLHALHATDKNELAHRPHVTPSPHRVHSGTKKRRGGPSSVILWVVLTLGIGLFTCGTVLVAVSLTGGRLNLWKIGTPLVLAGQALLFVGLALQLDILGYYQRTSNDATAAQLRQLAQPPLTRSKSLGRRPPARRHTSY
jgi:hypothetical protein